MVKSEPVGNLFATVCSQCHGPQGQGNEQLRAPSIAGRPSWYVERQLANFKSGRRGWKAEDVQGAQMSEIAKKLTPEQVKEAAKLVSAMPMVTAPAPIALKDPDVEEGKILFTERCMECHRYNASGEMTFGSPPLVGLQDWYLLAQIHKFKTGWRGVDANDPYGTKMKLSSQFIESEQAKHDVVAFILSLNPPPAELAAETPVTGP